MKQKSFENEIVPASRGLATHFLKNKTVCFNPAISGKQLKLNRTGYDNNKDSYRSKTQYAKHPNETQGAFIFDVGLLNYMTRKNPNFYVIHLENKFAITYSCVKSGVLKFEQIWILSRDQLPRRRSREMKRLEKIKSDLGINLPLYDERQRYCHPVEIAIDPIKILGDFWEKVYKAESKCAFPC